MRAYARLQARHHPDLHNVIQNRSVLFAPLHIQEVRDTCNDLDGDTPPEIRLRPIALASMN